MLKKITVCSLLALTTLTITGCAQEVTLEAAPRANDPHCAAVTVRLPDSIGELQKRATNAQATGAWGEPAAVITRCGFASPKPSTKPCVSVNGIDWLVDNSKAPTFRFFTYGRKPALEVLVDSERASGTDALLALAPAVAKLPRVGGCTSYTDTLNLENN